MSGVGHLGELDVINHVRTKLKHEVYLPLKDKGIDFVSVSPKGSFYQIQVKTSMFQKNSYFWFDLYKNRMRYSDNTYYAFVCYTLGRRRFMGKSFNCLFIPSLKLKEWISKKKIVSKKGSPDILNIFVYPDSENKTWKYRNKGKELDWTSYWNNFEMLV